MRKKIFVGVLVILVLASLGFIAWASITNPIQSEAQADFVAVAATSVAPI